MEHINKAYILFVFTIILQKHQIQESAPILKKLF
jgi:hypothetical protein